MICLQRPNDSLWRILLYSELQGELQVWKIDTSTGVKILKREGSARKWNGQAEGSRGDTIAVPHLRVDTWILAARAARAQSVTFNGARVAPTLPPTRLIGHLATLNMPQRSCEARQRGFLMCNDAIVSYCPR